MKYTCVDSFSGAGGLGLGLLRAGFETLMSFDNDSRTVQTQLMNSQYFKHEILLAGIEEMLDGVLLKKLNIKRGELFLLAGGPPCQGFSIQRIGKDEDTRNYLIFDYLSLIEEVLPKYFLMENVPGITGKRGVNILEEFIQKAKDLGYYIHQKILDAQDYGVPQRRRRVFLVGERLDGFLPIFSFPEPTTPEGKRVTVRMAIENLPIPPEDGSEHQELRHHKRDKLSEINKKRLMALKQGQGRDNLPEDLLASCHQISSSIIGHRNVYGRMEWDDVAPTITARFDSFTRGKFGHPDQLRTISLREGALLQSFPIDFNFSGNKVEIARQIGNAVPVLLAESLGKQIIRSHERKLQWVGKDEL